LILVDGHRVNHNLRDEGYIGTDALLDVDLIDTVEVIRGPGSILYGNNAFFGVINVHTRRGKDLKSVEVSSEAGGLGTYKGRVTLGNTFTNGVELMLSGSYYTSEGESQLHESFFATPANKNGIAQDMDGDQYKSFFGSLAYKDFTLEGAYLVREKVNPTAPVPTIFNDPRTRSEDTRDYVNLKFNHQFPDVVDVTANVYYDGNGFSQGYPVPGDFFNELQNGEWWGSEIQLNRTFRDRFTLTLGAEYRDDFTQTLKLVRPSTGATTTDIRRTTSNHGVYLQGDYEVVTNLHLNAGARYDQYGTVDPTFNPRLALIYNPWKGSAFKAIYGSAFRAPDFFELALAGTPNIRPETIKSYELIYEQELTEQIRSTASVFYNEMKDLITFVNPPGSYVNSSSASVKGTELGLDGYWADGVRGRLSYTYQSSRDDVTRTTLSDSPKHMVKASVSVPVFRKNIFAGLEVLYMSERTSQAATPIGSHAVVNFTLFSQHLLKGLDLSASVYNVFDNRFSDPARALIHSPGQNEIERDGRSFRFKLTYAF
jgi:iron complex outermembrane receptor protein